ncbi:MAG: Trp family transcriptional regulator [bacterium]
MNKSIKEISKIIAKSDEKFVEELLLQILTENEIDELAKRWELMKLLMKHIPQRKISELLGISLCKITRGSRELKKKNSALAKSIKGTVK